MEACANTRTIEDILNEQTEPGLTRHLKNFGKGILTSYVIGIDAVGSITDAVHAKYKKPNSKIQMYSLGDSAGDSYLNLWRNVNKSSVSGMALGTTGAAATMYFTTPLILLGTLVCDGLM